jgi:hypothetical protein
MKLVDVNQGNQNGGQQDEHGPTAMRAINDHGDSKPVKGASRRRGNPPFVGGSSPASLPVVPEDILESVIRLPMGTDSLFFSCVAQVSYRLFLPGWQE